MINKITNFFSAAGDSIKSIFGIIDKAIPDATQANAIKLKLVEYAMGVESKYWLSANVFAIVMLCNYITISILTILGKEVPDYMFLVFIVWAIGPILNSLNKETIARLIEFYKVWKQDNKKEK